MRQVHRAGEKLFIDYSGKQPEIVDPTSGEVREVELFDQLKSGVTQACRYEPGLQRTYEEMAEHYGTVVLPARPASPRTRPRSRWPCRWCSAGSSRCCATRPSSRWLR